MFEKMAAERVAAGAAFLDVNYPGWYNRINTDTLDIGWCDKCVLGQLYGRRVNSYDRGRASLGISTRLAKKLGFGSPLWGPSFRTLKKYWVEQIEARVLADAATAWFYAAPVRDDDPVHV